MTSEEILRLPMIRTKFGMTRWVKAHADDVFLLAPGVTVARFDRRTGHLMVWADQDGGGHVYVGTVEHEKLMDTVVSIFIQHNVINPFDYVMYGEE